MRLAGDRPLRRTLALLALASLAGSGVADKENVVKLTKYNFDNNVRHGFWFVKFYAPWCTHCQKLAPIWEKLADKAVSADWPVKIAEVDCTSSKEICEKVQIKAFPTLMLIGDGALKGKYEGEATVAAFLQWLSERQVLKAGVSGATARAGASGQSVLTEEKGASPATAAYGKAMKALILNRLARIPTQNQIVNLYFWAAGLLALLVGGLCVAFRLTAPEEEHEKEG
mmetsp:Transcript_9283/g.27836  ORF Transcript_9283/g.27836 Transcript_9283/m.27836 type:complete len:227 (-) Transcript_9283:1-681(-)